MNKDTKELFSPEIYIAFIKNHLIDELESAIRISLTVFVIIFIIGIFGLVF